VGFKHASAGSYDALHFVDRCGDSRSSSFGDGIGAAGNDHCHVSQDVYDTPTGDYLLIPQGSRLVGEYSNAIGYGQARIFVAWQRIIYPDGSSVEIGEARLVVIRLKATANQAFSMSRR
jgi:hypothetical protein